jgi:hypothetical protein
MANTYVWTVTSMSTLPSPPAPINDYVVWATYTVTGSNGDTPPITASITNNAQFTIDTTETPIPYDELTQEIVLGWIQEQPGIVSILQEAIDQQIYVQEHPPINPEPTPLPWSEPAPTPPV